MTRYSGWRTMTSAQRRNAKMEAMFERARQQGHTTFNAQEPLSTHKKLADLGEYEIWATPSGVFEVYSSTARVAIKRSETAAREWIAARQA